LKALVNILYNFSEINILAWEYLSFCDAYTTRHTKTTALEAESKGTALLVPKLAIGHHPEPVPSASQPHITYLP
jgi:hypothetical protein